MMNYKEFKEEYLKQESVLKDKNTQVQKLFKAIAKDMKSGDVKSARKDIASFSQSAKDLEAAIGNMESCLSSFDAASYFNEGGYAYDLLTSCKEKGINAIGEFPTYEMFPYKVKIDAENQDVYINKKKVQSMDPDYFTSMIADSQAKLDKAAFNQDAFANELEIAYETYIATNKNIVKGTAVSLLSLYKTMVPMARFRKDYDINAFSYDIARLYNKRNEASLKSGHVFEFGPGRKNDKTIRILDENGNEHLFSTISFNERKA